MVGGESAEREVAEGSSPLGIPLPFFREPEWGALGNSMMPSGITVTYRSNGHEDRSKGNDNNHSFIHSFIHSTKLLGTGYMLGAVLVKQP